jgi:hypothetical protein
VNTGDSLGLRRVPEVCANGGEARACVGPWCETMFFLHQDEVSETGKEWSRSARAGDSKQTGTSGALANVTQPVQSGTMAQQTVLV